MITKTNVTRTTDRHNPLVSKQESKTEKEIQSKKGKSSSFKETMEASSSGGTPSPSSKSLVEPTSQPGKKKDAQNRDILTENIPQTAPSLPPLIQPNVKSDGESKAESKLSALAPAPVTGQAQPLALVQNPSGIQNFGQNFGQKLGQTSGQALGQTPEQMLEANPLQVQKLQPVQQFQPAPVSTQLAQSEMQLSQVLSPLNQDLGLDPLSGNQSLKANSKNGAKSSSLFGVGEGDSDLSALLGELEAHGKTAESSFGHLDNPKSVYSSLQGNDYMNVLNSIRSNPLAQNPGSPSLQSDLTSVNSGLLGVPSFKQTFENNSSLSLSDPKSADEMLAALIAGGGGHLGAQVGANTNAAGGSVTEFSALVTQGANAKDRMSSESLVSISGGIRNATLSGGGEIRIHLKPNDMGEIFLNVVTDGSRVGLKIQASSEKAKQIIEESLSHLRESLSQHQLALGQVDLSVGSMQAQNDPSNNTNDSNQSQQQNAWNFLESNHQNGSRENGQERRAYSGFEGGSEFNSRRAPSGIPAQSVGLGTVAGNRNGLNAYRENGRLDVRG